MSGGLAAAPEPGKPLFLGVVFGLAVLHILLAVVLPLSGDEAYYWDCSRHLNWSYFDQPPLVIWAMVPCRLLLGETHLAVRAPAILASLFSGLLLLPLLRRLGGGPRSAALAYGLLHGMPLYFIGSFYASTDAGMTAAYLAATVAAVALVQGERRGWWGFGAALGFGFLAKFPVILVLPVLVPALLKSQVRRHLRTATPYLAALLALILTAPVWIWAARNQWANVVFQLQTRHQPGGLTFKYLGEFIAANLLLATPFLALAVALAWWRGWRQRDPAWQVLLVATAMPLLAFSMVALRSRVGAHWGGPGLVVGSAAVAVIAFRGRLLLIVAGMLSGLVLALTIIVIALRPEAMLDLEWSYRGRPHRISTDKIAAAVGNTEIAAAVTERRRPGELVASESYTTVHLLAFHSAGALPTRLAHVKPGKHGLASLYWYRPSELIGRDVLFVTEKQQVDERLRQLFAEVTILEPIRIHRHGREVRTVRLLRCSNLLHPQGAFTRLVDQN